jgi:hypothetical protein
MDVRMDAGALSPEYIIAGQQQLLEQVLKVDMEYGHSRHVPKYFRVRTETQDFKYSPAAVCEALLNEVWRWPKLVPAFGEVVTDQAVMLMRANLENDPTWPSGKLACNLPKVVIPGGPHANVEAYWQLLRHYYPSATRWEELYNDANRIHLLEGITLEPGISWATLDLGCHVNRKPVDVRSATTSPTVEVLAAACLFKGWIDAMINGEAPNVFLTGFIVDAPGLTAGRYVPTLFRYNGHPLLHAYFDGRAYPDWAGPELRESQSRT